MTLEVKAYKATAVVSHHFSFKEGWAIFTVNDTTGEFLITSDWGNFSYRWTVGLQGKHPDGRNVTLTEFLASVGPDYVVTKFSSEGVEALKRVVDEEATKARVEEELREPCYGLREEEVQEVLAELDFSSVEELTHAIDHYPDLALDYGTLAEILTAPWELVVYKDSATAQFLQEELLPFFFQWLREHEQETPEARARRVAQAVFRNIDDRRGCSFDGVDADIKEEILADLTGIILKGGQP